jgi:RNA polymerase sigma-70 factor (ECF subfamily)
MDELALIADAQVGDVEAFNSLVLKYQDRVYTQAFRILGVKESAEDAAQEAFISAFTKINTFRGGSFIAWLLRIVTNQCYDEIRRNKRKPTTSLEPLNRENEEIESPNWLIDPQESPEGEVMRLELDQAIQECLNHMSLDFRTVVILVDLQGFDYSEAASVVGSPLGTIKSRLARARKNLQECLQGFEELLPAAFRQVKESRQ